MTADLTQVSAVQAAEAIRDGRVTSVALVSACLDRISATDDIVRAWAWLDRDHALEQAEEADRIRRAGRATGPLHGVPVGLKDIVDTAGMPTQRGSEIFAGRQSQGDARMVERLRDAGAVIMGKTKTTELAYMHPTDTTNPHAPDRTPGGSSSGSAAAVAARHVPLAVGTQTGGSVIRPASFCGTFGFKPSCGAISREGVFRTSATLDQVGAFGNTLEDVALLTDVLGCYDQRDPASFPRPRPQMLDGTRAEVPAEPVVAWFDMPYHDRLEPDAAAGLDQVVDLLGDRVERMPAAPQLAGLTDVHRTIYDYEIARNIQPIADEHGARLSDEMTQAIARGGAISQSQYDDAIEVRASACAFFSMFYNDFDAIIAPSATGEALPLSAGNTGDAVFCTIWTLAGLPCLTLPALVGANGLPVGVQLVGGREEDDRLLRTAAWFQRKLTETEETEE